MIGWAPRGIGVRIAVAAIAVAVLAVAIVAGGALVFGSDSFVHLMTADGHSAASAQSMFDDSVGRIVLVAIVLAIVVGIGLAAVLGSRIARPLRDVGRAARRLAAGDYSVRVPNDGPEEVAGVAASFNQMAAALQEQERLRREFIANAAHELRTPLTNLQGYLEGLRDDVIPADRATFESLWEEAERLVRLSRSLDVLAAGDAGRQQLDVREVDLGAAIRAAADLARPSIAHAGLRFDVEAANAVPVRADPDALAQVLGNLLQNATRYTPRGGSIRLGSEMRAHDAVVWVTNTGPGIPPDDLPYVFDRFFRVERSRDAARGGAGIGLAIVRQLVESLGGRVGAESAGGLTRFWFSLPAC